MTISQFDSEKADRELREKYNVDFIDLFISNGFTSYLFGGSLRDMVLEKSWKDADIRVWIPLPPKERDEKTEMLLKEAGIEIQATIRFNDKFTIYRFLPSGSTASGVIDFTVVTGQWEVDPDFVMNGLYFDLGTKTLIDRYGALEDLDKKIIRTVLEPNTQFTNEPQMLFRTIKVACQFGFMIEPKTLEALKTHSALGEGVFGLVADDTFAGLTEWFVNIIYRGLNYNPQLFEQLWNDTGLTRAFINFNSKRLEVLATSFEIKEIFETGREYKYEEAISMFLSAIARAIDPANPTSTFDSITKLNRVTQGSQYGDFVIDTSLVEYVSAKKVQF